MNINRYALREERKIQKIISKMGHIDATAIGMCNENRITSNILMPFHDNHLPISVFVPKRKKGDYKKFPVIVDIYGGGFVAGRSEQNKHFGAWCAEHGYLTFIPEYSPGPETNLFGQIGDLLNAFAAINRYVDSYDGDKSQMYLVGDGAGAALACLTYSIIWNPVSMQHLEDELPFDVPQDAKLSFKAMCLQNGIFTLSKGKTGAITPYIIDKDWQRTSYAECLSPKTYAAALCRAEMVEKDSKLGAYSYQAAANTTLAEWINNGIYMDDPRANVGEVICVAFDGKNYFSVAGGMGKVDVSKIGMAPFWFALWGMFRSKLQEFDATFKAYCETQEIDETTRQKLACKMAGTAFDATMGDEINCIAPSTTTCRALKEEQTRSAKYTPDEVWGEFQKLDISGSSSTKVPTFKKTAKFVGAFADKNRVLTDEEKSLVPQLGEDYILPKEVVTTCHLIARTRGTARPMTNVMLRGDPSVGKTAGARAIAAGLGLPYTFITCNAGTEMYNLIGDMMPVDSSASADSINEELFKDLPSATDISMDPAAAYEAITGSEKPDATEVECMTELFRKQMKLCADACNNGFKYVESPLVRAIRNGWVCELQEPSLITRPAVMPGLNGLLDETGCVVLPTGEMLHRHPDCIIISTLNIDLEGCRPLNQAFMDRHHIIMDMQCPTDDVIVKRIKGMTGCGDDVPLKEMVQCIHQIATVCARHGATDGNVNSMRSLANWVQAGMLIGDYVKAAEWTVVSGATSDPETRTELSRTVANYSF